MGNKLTWWILGALALGLVAGFVVHRTASPDEAKEVVYYLSIVTDLFLRMIKMIIAPLVLAALISGIGHMGGDASALGRIGGRAIAWFIAASFVSITIGIIAVNWLQPGVGLDLPLPPVLADSGIHSQGFDAKKFFTDLVPKSIFEAMAGNHILQIVVFSIFAGIALSAMGEKGAPLLKAMDALMHLMLIVTGYVMRFAPLAVFAAVTATISERGLGVLVTYGAFMGGFYVALVLLMATILFAGGLVIGMKPVLRLAAEIRDPIVLAFTTASSEAAYPRTLDALDRVGVPRKISSFVLPLGYSFNLDGSMMYCAFATIFIAQAYGIDLSIAQEVTMLLILMVTSKGMAGVPRASLVVIAATLGQFNIPEAGLILILAVDHFLDMGRSATNVVGNAVATAVVAEWEKKRVPAPAADG
ncbi:dicarboxylate/amino acid:cation symporter [Sandaracinobacteroides hominis]|uniref:dicarboxylate/amino acid:cation symporter n=1 Tax=Sandaracinobacteroides hominis TaxID=2780086 RepID=UPI0018F703C7|nr:dicarboxylate/amino acid:cation symporter [Sandaracinobacteroides hominis]